MPIEFSDYMESRLVADPLQGTEIWIISQDGESRRLTTQELADFMASVLPVWISRGTWGTLPTLPVPPTAYSTYYITVAGDVDFGDGPQNIPIGSIIGSKVANPSSGADFFLI